MGAARRTPRPQAGVDGSATCDLYAFVVERAAAADVGGAGPGQEIRAAAVFQVAALGEQSDVAALARVVADLNFQGADGGLEARQAAVGDPAGRVGMDGDDRWADG